MKPPRRSDPAGIAALPMPTTFAVTARSSRPCCPFQDELNQPAAGQIREQSVTRCLVLAGALMKSQNGFTPRSSMPNAVTRCCCLTSTPSSSGAHRRSGGQVSLEKFVHLPSAPGDELLAHRRLLDREGRLLLVSMALAGLNILKFLAYLREELTIVLATASSDAVLPQIMRKLERLGVKDSVVGLVIPTGYSFNLDAFSIYLTLAVVFIAQARGVAAPFTVRL